MSWQRIDENTYIDDTLVTCAEYQLFIDEMREQGKYYQPDHWASYQFPESKAREPILGVRHSDAVAFCEWLTNREESEWKYRLPTQEEADRFSIKFREQKLFGYWLKERFQFTWIGPPSKNPRAVESSRTFPSAFAVAADRTRSRPLNLDRDLTKTSFYLDVAERRERTQIEILGRVLGSARTLAIERALEFTLDPSGAKATINHSEYMYDDDFRIGQGSEWRAAMDRSSAEIDDLAFNLFTLQERIARRSPAFEGIRLVKERIR